MSAHVPAGDDNGAVVSVMQITLRARRFVPFFLIHAQRCLVQIRRSDGYLAGALCHDRTGAYWAATMWHNDRALLAYVSGGAHRSAMPKLADWAGEASFVRWAQATTELPAWPEMAVRMQQEGTRVVLPPRAARDPGVIDFAGLEPVYSSRI